MYESLFERFDALRDRTRKVIPTNGRARHVSALGNEDPTIPPPPDPVAVLAAEMNEWASEPEGARTVEWIDERIREANAQAHATAGTPQSAYWLGCEAGLRQVRDVMQSWRGHPAGTPPARPASGV